MSCPLDLSFLKQERFVYGLGDLEERNQTTTGNKPPKQNAEEIRSQHRIFTNQVKGCLFQRKSASSKIYCSTNPIKSLKHVAISDIRVNVPAKGSYLLLRTLEEPNHTTGISTIVEDHEGDVFLFTAYNFVSPELEEAPEDVFPIGTIFILKEPFLKPGLQGGFLIRSDCPSDIIIIPKHHELFNLVQDIKWKNWISNPVGVIPNSVTNWKNRGNELFKLKKYLLALESYQMALKMDNGSDSNMKTLLNLNMAATFLNLRNYESALNHALEALKTDPTNMKGLYRAGRSHYEMRQFARAKSLFERLLVAHENHTEGIVELNKCRKRLQEATGKVNLLELYLESKSNPKAEIDSADFIGPLKSVPISGKRRGMIATENIEPGTLLIVSKALIAEFQSFSVLDVSFQTNPDSTINPGEKMKVIQETAQMIIKNPNVFGAIIYDLPINDGFLDCVKPKLFCDETSKEEPIADVERIKKILSSNGVSISSCDKPIGLSNEPYSCGLFITPSYLNHSCLPNSSWRTFNNVMVVHAHQKIKTGEEVTICYVEPISSYSKKEKELNQREIKCICRLCELDRQEPEKRRQKRERLSQEAQNIFMQTSQTGNPHGVLQKMTKIVNEIEKIYNRNDLRVDLILPYYGLASASAGFEFDYGKALNYIWKALNAMGFDYKHVSEWNQGQSGFIVPQNSLFSSAILHCLELLVILYDKQGLHSKAKKFLRCLYTANRMMSGANEKMVQEMFKELPLRLK